MSATNELRRLLDERGVEWWNETDPEPQNVTMARAGGQLIAYHENANGSTGYHVCNTHDLTPEQAIAATLGTGTCHVEETERFECLDSRYKSFDYNPYITVHVMECSACGRTYEHVNGGYEFCPHCGRRIEVDE